MNPVERLLDFGASHTKLAIAVMVLATAVVGAGIPMVEQSSSLDQFQTESAAGEKLDYIEDNFRAGGENTTTVQIILRNGTVLNKEGLLASLEFQQTLRKDAVVGPTLSEERPTFGVANVIATRAIVKREATELRSMVTQAQQLNATIQAERKALQQNQTELAKRSTALNETAGALRTALTKLNEDRDADPRTAFEQVNQTSPVKLDEEDFQTFELAVEQLRSATNDTQIQAAYELGTKGVLEDEYAALQEQSEALKERAATLEEKGQQLKNLSAEIESQRATLRNATAAPLSAQIDAIESMNASAVSSIVETTLGSEEGSNFVFSLMPSGYTPGSTSAEATMLIVRQVTRSTSQISGTATDTIVESQLTIQDMAASQSDGVEYLVFGSGIITEEIDNSMADSLLVVGPLALLFVLLTLIVAYRDVLDIILGLLGIGSVLIWTFGFMGWFDIAFNQIFIAIPVLLIGLSIDYAIHIFMRHREERVGSDGLGSRPTMRIALGGVGIALVWVTATTAIGFLSNLISPVEPIQEFGLVSAVGIVAALLVFGGLVPSLKVELDGLLERYGFDREKRAFGTSGGRFTEVLALGATAARRSPYVIILLVVVVSATGAVGATQIDTTFEQEDFLAEDPPDWMKELPEPFAPSTYTIKENLEYVNQRFVRETAQAQLLLQGEVATADTMAKLETVETRATEKDVTQILSNGEADITSPLSVLETVAARNETMNATLAAADTDGDRVPDRNVDEVYDTLFAVAPEEAPNVIHRENGEYRAIRVVISTKGGADGDAVQTQMEELAASIDGNGLEVTATGGTILNNIVAEELLQTVIDSLAITLVAIFAFLMVTYRITDGSATLGAVTLLPVVFSLAWILGTMSLLDIPFNVVTGLITSLTIGLGVAYSIHISERYNQELERSADRWEAMRTAVTGTGGALLGSAATTVGGFGVLAFAILPPLQQFGLITGMTIIYAFLAAVLVLPSLLIVWTRFVGPDPADIGTPGAGEETVSDESSDAPPVSIPPAAKATESAKGAGDSEEAESPPTSSESGTDDTTKGTSSVDSESAETEDPFTQDGFVPATEMETKETED